MEKNSLIDKFINGIKAFYNSPLRKDNGRYLSWEHCYKCFHDARGHKPSEAEIDLLSLNLGFYLASWGMMRGSCFLLQTDYKIHASVVEEILKPEYDFLLGISCADVINRQKEVQDVLFGNLAKFLDDHYGKTNEKYGIKHSIKPESSKACTITDTLKTKIIMGTLGCTPAYDEYFRNGIKACKNVASPSFTMESILKLAEFYQQNGKRIDASAKSILTGAEGNKCRLPYPQMKLIDMGFWMIGNPNPR